MALRLLAVLALFKLTICQSNCPGYSASNVQVSDTGLTADLSLAGAACNIYGTDLVNLTLTVEYQTCERRSR